MAKRVYQVVITSEKYDRLGTETYIVRGADAADAYNKAMYKVETDYLNKYGENVWVKEKPYCISIEHMDVKVL